MAPRTRSSSAVSTTTPARMTRSRSKAMPVDSQSVIIASLDSSQAQKKTARTPLAHRRHTEATPARVDHNGGAADAAQDSPAKRLAKTASGAPTEPLQQTPRTRKGTQPELRRTVLASHHRHEAPPSPSSPSLRSSPISRTRARQRASLLKPASTDSPIQHPEISLADIDADGSYAVDLSRWQRFDESAGLPESKEAGNEEEPERRRGEARPVGLPEVSEGSVGGETVGGPGTREGVEADDQASLWCGDGLTTEEGAEEGIDQFSFADETLTSSVEDSSDQSLEKILTDEDSLPPDPSVLPERTPVFAISTPASPLLSLRNAYAETVSASVGWATGSSTIPVHSSPHIFLPPLPIEDGLFDQFIISDSSVIAGLLSPRSVTDGRDGRRLRPPPLGESSSGESELVPTAVPSAPSHDMCALESERQNSWDRVGTMLQSDRSAEGLEDELDVSLLASLPGVYLPSVLAKAASLSSDPPLAPPCSSPVVFSISSFLSPAPRLPLEGCSPSTRVTPLEDEDGSPSGRISFELSAAIDPTLSSALLLADGLVAKDLATSPDLTVLDGRGEPNSFMEDDVSSPAVAPSPRVQPAKSLDITASPSSSPLEAESIADVSLSRSRTPSLPEAEEQQQATPNASNPGSARRRRQLPVVQPSVAPTQRRQLTALSARSRFGAMDTQGQRQQSRQPSIGRAPVRNDRLLEPRDSSEAAPVPFRSQLPSRRGKRLATETILRPALPASGLTRPASVASSEGSRTSTPSATLSRKTATNHPAPSLGLRTISRDALARPKAVPTSSFGGAVAPSSKPSAVPIRPMVPSTTARPPALRSASAVQAATAGTVGPSTGVKGAASSRPLPTTRVAKAKVVTLRVSPAPSIDSAEPAQAQPGGTTIRLHAGVTASKAQSALSMRPRAGLSNAAEPVSAASGSRLPTYPTIRRPALATGPRPASASSTSSASIDVRTSTAGSRPSSRLLPTIANPPVQVLQRTKAAAPRLGSRAEMPAPSPLPSSAPSLDAQTRLARQVFAPPLASTEVASPPMLRSPRRVALPPSPSRIAGRASPSPRKATAPLVALEASANDSLESHARSSTTLAKPPDSAIGALSCRGTLRSPSPSRSTVSATVVPTESTRTSVAAEPMSAPQDALAAARARAALFMLRSPAKPMQMPLQAAPTDEPPPPPSLPLSDEPAPVEENYQAPPPFAATPVRPLRTRRTKSYTSKAKPPLLSDVQLKQLTHQNTTRNGAHFNSIDIKEQHIDCIRPPSPSSRIRKTGAAPTKQAAKVMREDRAKRRAKAMRDSTDEARRASLSSNPVDTHFLAPGDEEGGYRSPVKERGAAVGRDRKPPKEVKWDRKLLVEADEAKLAVPLSTRDAVPSFESIVKEVELDHLGNIPEATQPLPMEICRAYVVVIKRIYLDD